MPSPNVRVSYSHPNVHSPVLTPSRRGQRKGLEITYNRLPYLAVFKFFVSYKLYDCIQRLIVVPNVDIPKTLKVESFERPQKDQQETVKVSLFSTLFTKKLTSRILLKSFKTGMQPYFQTNHHSRYAIICPRFNIR